MELYQFLDSKITSQEMLEQLSQHIKPNSTLYLESDVATFGRLANPDLGKQEFLGELFSIFVRLAGPDGHVIVPTFSYSWGSTNKEKIFDVLQTKSKTGTLSEYVRRREGTIRTIDPMFSFSIFGKRKNELAKIENNSFGQGSVFAKMLRENAYLISFGLNQYDPTFVHHVEQFSSETFNPCPYRSLVEFKGELINENGQHHKGSHFCFMRALGDTHFFSDIKLLRALRQDKLIQTLSIGGGTVHISDCQSVMSVSTQALKLDPYFFVIKE